MINYIETETYEKMSRMAANLISAQIILKPDSVLGLATGSSPIGIYDQLTKWYEKGDLDFAKVRSVNLDEYVGLDENHPQSYRYFMQKNLFDRVNIKRENTYVPNGVAENYDEECRRFDDIIRKLGGIDVQLLGIGLDGHVGFNEPSDRFEKSTHVVTLQPSTIKANSRFFESENDVPKQAITLGLGAIMKAKKIILVAAGEAKRDILDKALNGPINPTIPASILQLHPDLTVIFSKKNHA